MELGLCFQNEPEHRPANAALKLLGNLPKSRRVSVSPRQFLANRGCAAFPSRGALLHEITQAKVFPSCASGLLRRTLDAKRRVLVGNNVVLVFWIDGLMLWRNVDLVIRELVFAEILKEVRVALLAHVDMRDGGIFVLQARLSVGILGHRTGVGKSIYAPLLVLRIFSMYQWCFLYRASLLGMSRQ
jgi:hypothetical protein